MLPDAMTLLGYFLAAVFVGALALLSLPYLSILSVLVFLPAFIIGFSFPSLIWISYVYGFEKVHVLPSKTMLKAFVFGMLSTIPALLVNTTAAGILGEGDGATLAVTLVVVAVVAPLIEEFSKPWGAVWVRDEVRGRLDGLIIGVTCGVGFALIENISYEFQFVLTGESAAAVWTVGSLARGLGSIMVHATGAGIIGYAYGRYRSGGDVLAIGLAYIMAVGMHAAWNGSSALFASVDWGIFAMVPLMIGFVIGAYFLLRYFIDRGAASEARGTGAGRRAASRACSATPTS
jgi:RsiW-degrading membrane proteinase PrsW (M82 family)